MNESPVARLSEGQKECLRLVQQGYTAKEIAERLPPLTFHAVEKRLKAAMARLGVSSRNEAARILADYEGQYQPLVYQPPDLPEMPAVGTFDPPLGRGAAWAKGDVAELGVREERVPYEAFVARERRELRPPFPTRGRRWNDLSYPERIGWMIALTAALAIGAGTILNALVTLSALFRQLPH